MLPIARQARYLGRYRQIAHVLGSHGFGFVLEQLGLFNLLSLPRRVILQIPPPARVGAAERLSQALIALGPTFVKLGQLLSTRPDLIPADFIIELSKLQDTVPPFPSKQAVALIEAELGQPLHTLFHTFNMTPLAAASLGQAHAAVLPTGEHVVVKVQRPDIATIINTDLAIITDLAALAQEQAIFGAQTDLVELVWEFRATLRDELNYLREASNAERFRRNFRGNPIIHIPTVYWDWTSARVLTTERIYGVKINDFAALDAAGFDRKRLANHSLQLIVQEVFQHGFFHSDPHPGNFFALPGEVIGAIDFGQVGTLDPATTRQLLLLLVALIDHDSSRALRALAAMGMVTRHDMTPALQRSMQRFIDRYIDRPLSELSFRETGDELSMLAQRHNLRLPSPIALLLKTLIMIEGTGLQIDPNLDVFAVAGPYAQRALASQFTPSEMTQHVTDEVRGLSEAMLALPRQFDHLLQRLNEGTLQVQTREMELQRLAGALIGAANRVAVGFVLAGQIIGLGLLGIAVGIGGWSGILPVVLGVLGTLGILVTGAIFFFSLVRGRDV